VCFIIIDHVLSFLLLFQSPTDSFFSSDPFKPSGSSSDSKKNTDNSQEKDSSPVKDPFSNPFGSDPFGKSSLFTVELF